MYNQMHDHTHTHPDVPPLFLWVLLPACDHTPHFSTAENRVECINVMSLISPASVFTDCCMNKKKKIILSDLSTVYFLRGL